jgi:hypothetical protein
MRSFLVLPPATTAGQVTIMNANVILGLIELFAYWGSLYAATGMWWINLTVKFMNWYERQEF